MTRRTPAEEAAYQLRVRQGQGRQREKEMGPLAPGGVYEYPAVRWGDTESPGRRFEVLSTRTHLGNNGGWVSMRVRYDTGHEQEQRALWEPERMRVVRQPPERRPPPSREERRRDLVAPRSRPVLNGRV